MHIKQVTIKNFRCFEELTVNLNPDVNIFVGNNGSGKSAVLDAIAAAIYPYIAKFQEIADTNFSDIPPIFQGDIPVQIENKLKTTVEFFISSIPNVETTSDSYLDFLNRQVIYKQAANGNDNTRLKRTRSQKRNSLFDRNRNVLKNNLQSIPVLFILVYYKSNRNLTNITDIENISNPHFERLDAFKNALDATANFTDLTNWFFVREFQELREGKKKGDINFELPDLKQIRIAISTIIAPNARVYFTQKTSAQLMVEWETETGEKIELSLNQLSSGYRNMLALVMDFARRLAQANPQMANPLEAEAVLMIDELDLHLHPTWQQKIIPDLRKVFPNTQIIATTHSPEIVTTVERHQVKILENYQIKECPTPTRGRSSSDIVSDVLGLEKLRPDTEESRTLTALFNAIDNGNLEEAKQFRDKLQDWEHFDPDLIRADMQIHRLQRKVNA